jgi:hypothetical protein
VVNKHPFKETILSSGRIDTSIRRFSESLDDSSLKWHWDDDNRIVHAIHKTDWMFQFDNKLPQPIEGKIVIPKGTWHRIIKGHGDLEIIVEKTKDI